MSAPILLWQPESFTKDHTLADLIFADTSLPDHMLVLFRSPVKMHSDDEPRIVDGENEAETPVLRKTTRTRNTDQYAGTRNAGGFLKCGNVLAQIRCCHRGSSRCWRYSGAKVVFRR
jgi:hypothetical protein